MNEEISKKSAELFEAITACALARMRLEHVRADRSAPSDSIMDAAMKFRNAERVVHEGLDALINLQVQMLHKAESEPQTVKRPDPEGPTSTPLSPTR